VKQYFLRLFIENQSHFCQNLVFIEHIIIIIRINGINSYSFRQFISGSSINSLRRGKALDQGRIQFIQKKTWENSKNAGGTSRNVAEDYS
jgi:hypothetical protein